MIKHLRSTHTGGLHLLLLKHPIVISPSSSVDALNACAPPPMYFDSKEFFIKINVVEHRHATMHNSSSEQEEHHPDLHFHFAMSRLRNKSINVCELINVSRVALYVISMLASVATCLQHLLSHE